MVTFGAIVAFIANGYVNVAPTITSRGIHLFGSQGQSVNGGVEMFPKAVWIVKIIV
jgi:hypothetical protein